MVTIIVPISRDLILDKLFASLELLQTPPNCNLLTIVDTTSTKLFEKVRNKTQESRFNERLCIQYKTTPPKQLSIPNRRVRIANVHNEIKKYLQKSEFVFGIEDDTIVPTYALKRLLRQYQTKSNAGFIQGAQIGRWGVPYVGAWKADDIYEPTKFTTQLPSDELQEIDAGGLFCFLTRFETYAKHEFKTFDNNALGPDVNFGMSLRQQGMRNFVDWGIKTKHYNRNGDIIDFINTQPVQLEYFKYRNKWNQNIL